MKFNLKNGTKFVLTGKGAFNIGSSCHITIEQDADYIGFNDENYYTKPVNPPNNQIPVTEDLHVFVQAAALFSPGNVVVCQANEKNYILGYGVKNKKGVQELISILEENGIKVIADKCTDKYLSWAGPVYNRIDLCQDGTLDLIVGNARKFLNAEEVKTIRFLVAGKQTYMTLLDKNGEEIKLKKVKFAHSGAEFKNRSAIFTFDTKVLKPVLKQFVENLRNAGYTVAL